MTKEKKRNFMFGEKGKQSDLKNSENTYLHKVPREMYFVFRLEAIFYYPLCLFFPIVLH